MDANNSTPHEPVETAVPAPSDGIPSSVLADLRRYMEIQAQVGLLEREKEELRNKLAAALEGKAPALWSPIVDGAHIAVTHRYNSKVQFDETALKERLGARYVSLLTPDPVKIRRNLPILTQALQPHLDLIGSPTVDSVHRAILQGAVRREELVGTYTETRTAFLAVRRQ